MGDGLKSLGKNGSKGKTTKAVICDFHGYERDMSKIFSKIHFTLKLETHGQENGNRKKTQNFRKFKPNTCLNFNIN